MKKIKVLTLDGGGVRGYLTAKILKNIEQSLNEARKENINLGQRFDLIVGTSTGGIIAAALSIGKSANEIFKLYETLIPKIFNNSRIFGTKYSNVVLKEELQKVLGELTLADVTTDLCLASVDIENSSPRFHKSNYLDGNSARMDEKLVDVVLASAAAPTFFPLVDTLHSSNLTDGGIVANNPSLVGFIEAMHLSNKIKDDISLVSVGTGEQCHMPYDVKKLKNGGKLCWIAQCKPRNLLSNPFKHIGSPLIELLMESQSKLAHYQTQFLLGERYLRLNPKLSISIEIDDAKKIGSLKNLANIDKSDLEKLKKLL
ncbi:MAG: patatin-like phospholipase family protein [Campylobacteraceae bacterium]|nr:patatin-like phospholipase family protein [Campylobacteraceae bacterium]